MQIGKKKLVLLMSILALATIVATYAAILSWHTTPVTFTVQYNNQLAVVNATTGQDWSSWDLGTVSRGVYYSGPLNVTYVGDSVAGAVVWWNSTNNLSAAQTEIVLSCERNNGGSWIDWVRGWQNNVTLTKSQVMQIRWTINVTQACTEGVKTGDININNGV